ncbi:MFS transporter [Chloroflexota bacterium]
MTGEAGAMKPGNSPAEIERSGRFFYGWIIVCASFLVITTSFGVVYSFGVFLNPLREYFGSTSAAISGPYSFMVITYTSSGIFAGWAVDRYGPKITTMVGGLLLGSGLLLTSQVNTIWQLYVTFGLMGVGWSGAYSPMMTTISRWFTRRKGLALGIISAGTGAGPLISAPLATYLIATSGWRFAYIVIASAAIIVIAASFLMKKNPEEIGELPDGKMYHSNITQAKTGTGKATVASGGLSLIEAIKTKSFWMLAAIFLLIGLGLQMVLAHIVAHSQIQGISPLTAAAVLSTITGTSIAGRIIMGTTSDRIGRKRALAICLCGEGAMMFWLAGTSSPWMLFLFAVVFGFSYGGHVPQLPALAGENLGLAHMGVLLGSTAFFWGIGGAIGPVLAGRIVDVTGNYSSAFIVGGIAMFLAAGITFLLRKAF